MPRGEMVAADTGLDGIEDDSEDELGESARLAGAGRSQRSRSRMRTSRLTCVLVGVILLACAAPLAAQPATSYTVKIYNQGASSPLTTTVLPAAAFTCAQPQPPPPTNTANPNKLAFNDPDIAGQACLYTDSGSGPLLALPFGTGVYVARIAMTNSAGTTADSADSNSFSRPGITGAVLTGVKAYR